MSYALYVGSLSLGLLLGMLLFQEIGRRIGTQWQDSERTKPGFGAIEGGVLALLGLLIAFTFSGAATRFDTRRQLIVEEANAIGGAYLRVDMLPDAAQPALRETFRRYLDARLRVYSKAPDVEAAKQELLAANELQREIWRQAVSAVRSEGAPPQAPNVVLPAVSAMMDLATTRTMTTQMHPPSVIFIMLFALALVSSLLAGYGLSGAPRSWLHLLCFPLVIAATVYVILDMEYPRLGLIRVDAFDQALVAVRDSMR